jgi:hypothetical protein
MAREEVPYVADMRMQLPAHPDKGVLMVYTEPRTSSGQFISSLFPDSEALDRALFARHFPAGATVPAGHLPWLLLDRSGKVLRSGLESAGSERWDRLMEARFPGIEAREVTITAITDETGMPIHDAAGKNLHLATIWLAPDSPSPRN